MFQPPRSDERGGFVFARQHTAFWSNRGHGSCSFRWCDAFVRRAADETPQSMMRRRCDMKYLLSSATAVAFALCAGTPALHAQSVSPVTHFGFAGGATVPTGDFNNSHNTGWNAMALLAFQMPTTPVGMRIEANYAHLNGQD